MDDRLNFEVVLEYQSSGTSGAQEDCFVFNQNKSVFALADGFGGAPTGEKAAQTSVKAINEFISQEARDPDATFPFVLRSYYSLAANVLFNAVLYANRKLLSDNGVKSLNERGGASAVTGFCDGDLLALASVGAVQAYLSRNGLARPLTTPRTYERLHDWVQISEAAHSAIPLTALGIASDLEPEIVEVRLKAGDHLWLASGGLGDGFWLRPWVGAGDTAGAKSALNAINFALNTSVFALRVC